MSRVTEFQEQFETQYSLGPVSLFGDEFVRVRSPEVEGGMICQLDGYIDFIISPEHNLMLHELSQNDAEKPATQTPDEDLNEWAKCFIIANGNKQYNLLVPSVLSRQFSENQIVRVFAKWIVRENYWHFVAMRIELAQFPSKEWLKFRVARIGRTPHCCYCRRRLNDDERWMINRLWTLECPDCAAFRAGSDPLTLLKFSRRLLRQHKVLRLPRHRQH